MALKFLKAGAKPGGSDENASNSHNQPSPDKPKNSAPKQSSPGVSFLKTGSKAKEAMETAEAQAELAKKQAGKGFRFYMGDGEERAITFLDGKLDDEGMLDIPMFYEHNIQVNGDWKNFVCTGETDTSQPCPICEKGDRPSLVGVMTVLDHTPYVVQKGPNKGKTYVNQRKLFVAKRQTITQLTNLAKKRGGLTGCLFDVLRSGETAARVGSQFDFQHKFATRAEIKAKFDLAEDEDVLPFDYSESIVYLSPAELLAMGVGKAPSGIGYSGGGGGSKSSMQDEL